MVSRVKVRFLVFLKMNNQWLDVNLIEVKMCRLGSIIGYLIGVCNVSKFVVDFLEDFE